MRVSRRRRLLGVFSIISISKCLTDTEPSGKLQSFAVKSWLKEQVLKVLRDRTAELLVKEKWPLLDVTSGAYTEEIEKKVLAGMGPEGKPIVLALKRVQKRFSILTMELGLSGIQSI